MRQLKLSFALIVAILAVGVTVASKANSFNSKAITDCFILLTVSDANQANQTVIKSSSIELSCNEANTQTALHKYVFFASEPSRFTNPDVQCPVDVEQYCCAKLAIVTPDPSITVPTFDLGDGFQRQYEVVDIVCKPTPEN